MPERLPGIAVDAPAVREHLREVVESQAFKGSRRGQQFLQYIVEKALTERAGELKERTVGVELFGRPPDYDTGEDAIVRVTASDVRKRLHQFYAETASEIHIELPTGSYAPEFRRVAAHAGLAPLPVRTARRKLRLAIYVLGALAIAASAWWWGGSLLSGRATPRRVLPWSALLREGRQLKVVLSDPDISAMQYLLGEPLSLSDYANRRYMATPAPAGGDLERALRLLRGVNVPVVDVGIALNLERLASAAASRLKTHTARSLQLGDFKTDDDFVLLGSPRSNPWSGLFQDQLDFDFIWDAQLKREVIRNKRLQVGEASRYVPTAHGWDTGDAFAIVALVGNPSQAGKVLLLAGTNAEGTEAAGSLATNLTAMARVLEKHGIAPSGPPRFFEALLQVHTMAGSPNTFEVKALHQLPGGP